MDFDRHERSQPERTRREDRPLKFYELRDNLCGASNGRLPASYDRCMILCAWDIADGEIDGVDVGGLRMAAFFDVHGLMRLGDWKVGLFVDERADEAQHGALTDVFLGNQGGPMSLFYSGPGKHLGVQSARIAIAEDGRFHRVTVDDIVDVEIEDFEAAEPGQVMTVVGMNHPCGPPLTIAHAVRSSIKAFGYELALVGRHGHAAAFKWKA